MGTSVTPSRVSSLVDNESYSNRDHRINTVLCPSHGPACGNRPQDPTLSQESWLVAATEPSLGQGMDTAWRA